MMLGLSSFDTFNRVTKSLKTDRDCWRDVERQLAQGTNPKDIVVNTRNKTLHIDIPKNIKQIITDTTSDKENYSTFMRDHPILGRFFQVLTFRWNTITKTDNAMTRVMQALPEPFKTKVQKASKRFKEVSLQFQTDLETFRNTFLNMRKSARPRNFKNLENLITKKLDAQPSASKIRLMQNFSDNATSGFPINRIPKMLPKIVDLFFSDPKEFVDELYSEEEKQAMGLD